MPSIGSDLGIREVDINGGTDNGNGKDMGLVNGGKWLAMEAVSWHGVGVLRVVEKCDNEEGGDKSSTLEGLLLSERGGLAASPSL